MSQSDRPPYVMPNQRLPAYQYVMGVDPDKEASGLAVWCYAAKGFAHYDKHRLLDLLRQCKVYPPAETIVWVEAGWQNKGMLRYHKDALPNGFAAWSTKAREAYMFDRGTDVGINAGVGHSIIQLLMDMGYRVEAYQPRTAKWGAAELALYTGITARINQDVRDAIRAAFLNK